MSRLLTLVIVIIVILLGVTFHLRNDQLVVLDYFIGSKEFYLSAWLIAAFTIGAILGLLASLPILFKLNRDNAKIAKQLKTALPASTAWMNTSSMAVSGSNLKAPSSRGQCRPTQARRQRLRRPPTMDAGQKPRSESLVPWEPPAGFTQRRHGVGVGSQARKAPTHIPWSGRGNQGV